MLMLAVLFILAIAVAQIIIIIAAVSSRQSDTNASFAARSFIEPKAPHAHAHASRAHPAPLVEQQWEHFDASLKAKIESRYACCGFGSFPLNCYTPEEVTAYTASQCRPTNSVLSCCMAATKAPPNSNLTSLQLTQPCLKCACEA
jgi:hypothetical protein